MKWTTSLALASAPLALAKKAVEDRGVTIINADASTEVVIVWANAGDGAPTTTLADKVTMPPMAPAATDGGAPPALASHTVTVGGPGGLTFQPDSLNNIPIGDTVIFEFLSTNHSVTQSTFDKPCDPQEGGMDSGFMANPDNSVSPPPQVAMQVMVDTPLWFHCEQKGHCGKGMTFSINPTDDKTQAQFQAKAIEQKGDGQGTGITGGDAPPPPAEDAPAGDMPPADMPSDMPAAGAPPAGGDSCQCECVVQCAPGGFPSELQGIGAMGGAGGSIPVAMGSMTAPPAEDAPPAEEPPADAEPTEAAPTEEAPTEAAPTDAPTETEAAPTEEAPTEAAPTDAAPTEDSSSEEGTTSEPLGGSEG